MRTSGLCRRRTGCRLCGGDRLTPVFSLTPTPPANAFVPAAELNKEQERFPLDLFFCERCSHLQLLDVVDPAALFENYVYVSGTSPVFVKHFSDYAHDLIKRFNLKPGQLAVDIGSNDGTFLRFFKDAGLKVLGIDPAKDIAAKATASGIDTFTDFFTPVLAERLVKEKGPAALITANNVFAHADDLRGIAQAVRGWLAPDGVFVFEVSYLLDVYEKTLFDTIYHEHLAYHSVKPLRDFFAAQGLELIEAIRVGSHGGSLRGIAQRKGGPRKVGNSVGELIHKEDQLGLHRAQTFRDYAKKIDALKERLSSTLKGLKAKGKKIAAFGAPAKATTLMYHFGLGPDVVDFIVDDSPLKQGLYSPGLHIPVLPSSAIAENKPDYLLILAWNFADSIIAKNKAFKDAGGHWIVPLPHVELR
jgi:SAM-dependent methyltransferase